MKKIAIIEDDKLFHEVLHRTLKKAGYQVADAFSLAQGYEVLKEYPSLLIIDRNLPDGDGVELCRKVKVCEDIPVLFLTARDEEKEVIKAFDLGADDYLVKPFSMAVLLKHIEAIFRRMGKNREIFQYENLKIDFERKQVFSETEEVKLTAKEYKLLEILAKNKGRVLTKTMLLQQVWDVEGTFVEENTVNVTLNRLKKKIEPDPSNPIYITNLFGIGYTFGK